MCQYNVKRKTFKPRENLYFFNLSEITAFFTSYTQQNISLYTKFSLPVEALNVSLTSAAVDGIWNLQRTTLARRKTNVLERIKFPH